MTQAQDKPFTIRCYVGSHAAHVEHFEEQPVAARYARFCVGQWTNNFPDPQTGRAPSNTMRQFTAIRVEDTATGRLIQEITVGLTAPARPADPTMLRLHLDEEAGR